MDTDDLSKEAYEAVISTAEAFSHDLCLHFGVLAGRCEGEEEYLNAAKKLADKIKRAGRDNLEDIFFGVIPDKKALASALEHIVRNIQEVEKIPYNARHFEDWA